MAEGFVKKLQTTPQHFKKKQNEKFTGGEEGRHPQRRAQSDGQGEPAGRRRERGLSRSESARSVKAGGISPEIREDGAGRGLLRGAPTRPLARPRAQAPLKLPEAWRAEPLSAARCRTQPRAAQRKAPRYFLSPALLRAQPQHTKQTENWPIMRHYFCGWDNFPKLVGFSPRLFTENSGQAK